MACMWRAYLHRTRPSFRISRFGSGLYCGYLNFERTYFAYCCTRLHIIKTSRRFLVRIQAGCVRSDFHGIPSMYGGDHPTFFSPEIESSRFGGTLLKMSSRHSYCLLPVRSSPAVFISDVTRCSIIDHLAIDIRDHRVAVNERSLSSI